MANLAEQLYSFASRVGADMRDTRKKVVEIVRARAYGATGTNSTADTNAVAAARAAAGPNRGVLLDSGDFSASTTINAYGTAYKDALGLQVLLGSNSAPATRRESVFKIEKITSTSQATGQVWDEGAGYFSLEKRSGDSYSAALTGYGHHNGGTNDVIGVHGRVRITTSGAGGRGWGIWGYTVSSNPVKAPWHAAEFNGANEGVDPEWGGTGQCVRICMSDISADGNRMSTGLTIGKSTHGGNNGFYTGIDIEADAVIPSANATDNNEAIKIAGPATGGHIGGLRFRQRLKYALRTTEATFASNVAGMFAINHKLAWGGDWNTPVHIYGTAADVCVGTHLNLDGTGSRFKIQGVPVLNNQQPNIPTITAGSTNNDTKNNVINAIISTLRTHGLIVPGTLTTS